MTVLEKPTQDRTEIGLEDPEKTFFMNAHITRLHRKLDHHDVAELAAMGFDEFLRLHEHAAGTAAGIVDAAFVGSEHLDQEANDALRSVELSAFLALRAGELAEEVFVDAAEQIDGTMGR